MALNFNATTPAAPSGSVNVDWQVDVSGNVSANVSGTSKLLPAVNSTGLTANVALVDLLAAGSVVTGIYRVSGYTIVTTPDGVSSTLPKITISYTDANTGVVLTKDITATKAGNTTSTFDEGDCIISALTANPIQYDTSGYASGTPATMTYALHLVLEKLF